jgi:hypothetical protein
MAFNFHGPWATRAMQEPALQILAAVLHHRCQIETVLTHDIRAWEQAARLPFPACGAGAPSTHPPRILPDTCEASKQHEDPAVLRDL